MTNTLDNSKINLYLFLEAFSFKLSEDNKYSWADELREIIPFTSYQSNIEQYEKLYRRRKVWEKGSEEFGFEKELSLFHITRCFMNAYGLGFLLLPIRYIATLMKISKICDRNLIQGKKHSYFSKSEYQKLKYALSNYNRPKLILPVDEAELQSIEKGFIKIDGETYAQKKHVKYRTSNDDNDIDDALKEEPIIIKLDPKWRKLLNFKPCPIQTAENLRKRNERGITYISCKTV